MSASAPAGRTQQAATDDVQTPTGVRLTIADHERITKQIQAETGITISDWVWENYSEGADHLDEALALFNRWLNTIPRDLVHGERPPGGPYSLFEARHELLKSTPDKFNAARLGHEEQYWQWLRLHQVSADLLTECRQELYRIHLLPENRRVAGANVDVLALLDAVTGDGAPDVWSHELATIARTYASGLMELLLEKAAALAARRPDGRTTFDFRNGPQHVPALTPVQLERAARPAEIEGAIANHNGQFVVELKAALPSGVYEALVHAWQSALYPFLWDSSLESRLARINKSSPPHIQSLAAEVRAYQRAMQQELWTAQRMATSSHDPQQENEYPWAPFGELKTEVIKRISAYKQAFVEAADHRSAKR